MDWVLIALHDFNFGDFSVDQPTVLMLYKCTQWSFSFSSFSGSKELHWQLPTVSASHWQLIQLCKCLRKKEASLAACIFETSTKRKLSSSFTRQCLLFKGFPMQGDRLQACLSLPSAVMPATQDLSPVLKRKVGKIWLSVGKHMPFMHKIFYHSIGFARQCSSSRFTVEEASVTSSQALPTPSPFSSSLSFPFPLSFLSLHFARLNSPLSLKVSLCRWSYRYGILILNMPVLILISLSVTVKMA